MLENYQTIQKVEIVNPTHNSGNSLATTLFPRGYTPTQQLNEELKNKYLQRREERRLQQLEYQELYLKQKILNNNKFKRYDSLKKKRNLNMHQKLEKAESFSDLNTLKKNNEPISTERSTIRNTLEMKDLFQIAGLM
ncbi:hypothetical protein HDU92_005614 [Lobulomyces angularis]|nr:hypothetical protein HDU92_005614 [Lobulomyces angularis]